MGEKDDAAEAAAVCEEAVLVARDAIVGRCFIFVREERRGIHAKLRSAWLFVRDLAGFSARRPSRHKSFTQNQGRGYETGLLDNR